MIRLSPEELDQSWCVYIDDVLKPYWKSSKVKTYARVTRNDYPASAFEKWLGEYGGKIVVEGTRLHKKRYLDFADDKLSTAFLLRWL